MLAEAFGEPLTEERIEIYARALADLSKDRLNIAFQRALRERSFFPKVAELRSLAASTAEDQKKIEANAAWDYVNEYLRKWGVDLLPLYSNGKVTTAPQLDARTDYALRRIGGFQALNQVDVDKMPFMYRDFCEAYALAPVADLLALPLRQQFGGEKLMGSVKLLTEAKRMEHNTARSEVSTEASSAQRSDAWYAKRRAELKRQADELAKRGKQ